MTLPRRHVHLIGIGGTGMSAIARVLIERGILVSGSDRSSSPAAQELSALGAQVYQGHDAQHIHGADVVVRSSAIPDTNPEVQAALAAGIPVLKRAKFLEELLRGTPVIAVAGTHGKTSTTAMIAWMLHSLGQDPSYIIGSPSANLGCSAHQGSGSAFVIEADEYDRMFLGLNPQIALVTYLEHDHPDCFPTFDDYTQAFEQFIQRMPSGASLLLNGDLPATRRLSRAAPAGVRALSYGIGDDTDFGMESVTPNLSGGFDYIAVARTIGGMSMDLANVSLQVPGMHNALNSLGALAAVLRLLFPRGATEGYIPTARAAAQALHSFSGTDRRFEVKGSAGGVTFIEDYAHHPTAVRATLAAARARHPQARLWAIWQPHTYSRTLQLADAFVHAFSDADQVLVMEVYAARESAAQFDNFSSAQLVTRMDHPAARFAAQNQDVIALLLRELRPGDVVVTLSAGDAEQIGTQTLAQLQATGSMHNVI